MCVQFSRRAIKSVADDGMTDGCEMDADLVSAAGINPHIQEREFSVWRRDALADGVMGDGFASAFAPRSHASAANAIAADAGGNRPAVLFGRSVNQCDVGFLYLPM